jgi:cysteine desulfurase/selenocysteine lyase
VTLDVAALRAEFPLLARSLDGTNPIVYLDSASTTPKPRRVLDAMRRYHEEFTANVGRGVHALAVEATQAYESVRHLAAGHLGASPAEVVFTRGTTEALNLVAASLGLTENDEVILTLAEHHSNQLPWRANAKCVYLPSRDDGVPRWDQLEAAITSKTKLVAVHHASNVLGTVAPLAEIVKIAKRKNVPVVVDGAQGAGHVRVDVSELGCDFYAFSGHKLGAPTGVGVLYAKAPWLEMLAPWQWGGGMVARVGETELELRDGPARFEAGTPNVEGVLGLGAALEMLRDVGMDRIEQHGTELAQALSAACADLPGVRVLGLGQPAVPRIPLVALALPDTGLDAESLSRTLSDGSGIMVSAGQHCTHRLHASLETSATLRASAWAFNTTDEVARFAEALRALL